jgi:WD40 repeat protein
MVRTMQVPWAHRRGPPPPGMLPLGSPGGTLEAMVANSMRVSQRYVGHCNMRTDIKEAVFVGQEDKVIACGSDHGHVLLFDAATGELLRLLWADTEVANCVQCHPSRPVLATSGLEDTVRGTAIMVAWRVMFWRLQFTCTKLFWKHD